MDTLEKEMYKLSETKRYENAAKVRDRLQEFKYISEQVIVDYGMDEDDLKIAKEERTMKALAQFVQKLKLPEVKLRNGFKIECYDISNIQGKNATGSMIVFVDGKPKKSFYRKFRIRAKDTPDDFLMMQEMLTRRLARIDSDDKSFSEIPDVMIIDGGKGQLSSAFEILQDSIHQIPLISLAKREEELFIPKLDLDNKLKYRKVILPRNSQELYLIQRIRDEAHRFAITYHRNLRSKSQITTTLDSIPGIGPKTKKKLLLKYGSFEGIRKAKKNDLKKIINNTRAYEEILKKL
jgi:excinuclease ABC subunit C